MPLILDLVEWVAKQPRAYNAVMDVWRTSCPRLTIWEDAVDADLVRTHFAGQSGKVVEVTEKGQALLTANGRSDYLIRRQ